MNDSPHDTTNIRISNRINFFAPVVFIGAIPIVGLPLSLFFFWLIAYRDQALVLSSVFVYGVAGTIGVCLLCVTSLAIAFTRYKIAYWKNRANLLVYGEIAVLLNRDGYDHLSAQHEASKLAEPPSVTVEEVPQVSDDTILELYGKGLSLRDIVKVTGQKYNRVQAVTHAAKNK